jgi:hypothetical protein
MGYVTMLPRSPLQKFHGFPTLAQLLNRSSEHTNHSPSRVSSHTVTAWAVLTNDTQRVTSHNGWPSG